MVRPGEDLMPEILKQCDAWQKRVARGAAAHGIYQGMGQ